MKTDFDALGDVLAIQRIGHACEVCGKPATRIITRSNKGLPAGYDQAGHRELVRCDDHTPADAKKMWEANDV